MKNIEIISICIAAILTAITSSKWKAINTLSKITLISIIVASVLTAINSYRQTAKDAIIERVNAKFGNIEDLYGSTIPKMKIGSGDNAATFILGGTGTFDFKPFGPLIKLYIKDNKLFVNTIIRNLDGKVIAVIEDNTWTLYENDFEYNDDNSTTFELVNKGERKVFFQIQLINGIASISGYLLNDKGLGFIFYDAPKDLKGSLMHIIRSEEDKAQIPNDIVIPRIFKYPRDKYYGIRI